VTACTCAASIEPHEDSDHRADCGWAQGGGWPPCGGCWGCLSAQQRHHERRRVADLTTTDDPITVAVAAALATQRQRYEDARATLGIETWDLTGCTCYLGWPDDPDADQEACAACDRAYWRDPVFIDLGGDRP
jgi:hypothetical protein